MTPLELIRPLDTPSVGHGPSAAPPTSVTLPIAHGFRRAGPGLAIPLERELSSAVTCEELRPDAGLAYLRNSGQSPIFKPDEKKPRPRAHIFALN